MMPLSFLPETPVSKKKMYSRKFPRKSARFARTTQKFRFASSQPNFEQFCWEKSNMKKGKALRHKPSRKKCFCFVLFVCFFANYFHRRATSLQYFAQMSLFFCPANLNNFERKDTDIMFKCKRERTRSQKISSYELSQKPKKI